MAKIFVWSFFLLIFNNTLGIAAGKYGILPGRPVYYYAIIAFGLCGLAAFSRGGVRALWDDKQFFVPFTIMVVLGALMYRSDAGPDFGGRVMLPDYTPSRAGSAAWPALNFVTGASLYILARNEDYRRTIINAVLAAFTLQLITMESDMWFPAVFGDPNGRAGGLAQNANQAALLVTVLASLVLPTRIGDRMHKASVYVLMLAVAAVLLTQSKTGILMMLVLASGFAISRPLTLGGLPRPSFVAGYFAILALTVVMSPVLNGTAVYPDPIFKGVRVPRDLACSGASQNFDGCSELQGNLSLSERLRRRSSADGGMNSRGEALSFYAGILKENYLGLGTGFTNKFITGPHNSFLKLAIDNGIGSALFLVALLIAVTWRAFSIMSPQLISLSLNAWLAAMLYHTFLVDPIVLPAVAIGLAQVWLNAQAVPNGPSAMPAAGLRSTRVRHSPAAPQSHHRPCK